MGYDVLPDPRVFQATVEEACLTQTFDILNAYLIAPTQQDKERYADELFAHWDNLLAKHALFDPIDACRKMPSVELARALIRLLAEWEVHIAASDGLAIRFFAIPVLIVAAAERSLSIRAVLGQKDTFEAMLKEKQVLGTVQQWGMSNAMCKADMLSGMAWVDLMSKQSNALIDGVGELLKVAPSDIVIQQVNQEQVYLRFLIGAAIISAKTSWLSGASPIEAWGMSAAESLSQQLSMPGATVLALPRTPHSLIDALQEGLKAQREMCLQLFVSNAVRDCRTKFGEPTVVLSSHITDAGIGEVRISISSEFSAKDAQGFKCELYPYERIVDVQRAIEELLQACQVTNIRLLKNVYPDREAETGLTLLFKPEAIPEDELFA